MRENLYVLVCLLVLMSGCTDGETKVQNSELLRLSDVTVTPSSVVLPGEVITIRMKITNIGQEIVRFGRDKNEFMTGFNEMDGLLFDTCSIYGVGDNAREFTLIANGFEIDAGTSAVSLKPGRASILEWTIKAPEEDVISKMKHECNFKFRAIYKARAETYTYIYFANPEEKNQRVYTNQDMNLKGENVANFGPVYINFDTAQEQPIKGSKSGEENDWTIYITLKNIGNGIGDVAGNSALFLDLPPNIVKSGTCAFETSGGDLYIKEESKLKLYSKQTSRFSCVLKAPVVPILEPYRFVSSVDYIYTMDKTVKIVTMPAR